MEYYVEGFECQQCGNCCKGDGLVRITRQDAKEIAAFLGISVQKFYCHYTFRMNDEYWLWDKGDKECIFLNQNRCTIHEAKPLQCRDYPKKWRTFYLVRNCPGLQKLYGKE